MTAWELFKMAKIRLSSQQAANKNLKPSILYVKVNAGSNSCVCYKHNQSSAGCDGTHWSRGALGWFVDWAFLCHCWRKKTDASFVLLPSTSHVPAEENKCTRSDIVYINNCTACCFIWVNPQNECYFRSSYTHCVTNDWQWIADANCVFINMPIKSTNCGNKVK